MEKTNYISPFQFLRMGLSPSVILYEPILEEIRKPLSSSRTKISSLISLYRFDQKLKKLLLAHIQMIEEKLRALLTYYFCCYFDHSFDSYLDFEHYHHMLGNESEIFHLIHELSQLKHPKFLSVDNSPLYPPVWTMTNAISFPLLSQIYYFSKPQLQKDISFRFQSQDPNTLSRLFFFLSAFQELGHTETICFFNAKCRRKLPDLTLHQKLGIPKNQKEYLLGKNDILALFLALDTLLPQKEFLKLDNEFLFLFWDFIEKTPDIDPYHFLNSMGIPSLYFHNHINPWAIHENSTP